MTVLGTDERDEFTTACEEHAELGRTEWSQLCDAERHTMIALWVRERGGLSFLLSEALDEREDYMLASHLRHAAETRPMGPTDAATYCIGRMVVERMRDVYKIHACREFEDACLHWLSECEVEA